MVLIDFYRLAVSFKLSCGNVGISNPSHPPSIPATTPSDSRSPPNQSDRIGPFVSPTQFAPKTPEHEPNATHSVSDRTLLSVGTSCAQDFKHHRVFVDIEVFMKHVLHVPEDWRELLGETIQKIKRDPTFSFAHLDYSSKCRTQSVGGRFYRPLVDMANAIFSCSESSQRDRVKPRANQRCLRNYPKGIRTGVMNDLSPGLVAVQNDFLPQLHPEEHEEQDIKHTHISWAGLLQMLEVKPSGGTLVDGSSMPRLKVNGRDPQRDHAHPCTPKTKKRPADEPSQSSRKALKMHHWSTPGGASDQAAERMLTQSPTDETKQQKGAHHQVGRYLLEQFAIPAFRSHATIGLVDRDRIQFYHANHSVILVSSGINFSSSDRTGGLDKFIAIVIAFSRLSLRDNGILHDLHDGKLFWNNEKPPISKLAPGAMRMQEGNRLEFGGDENTESFTLKLGEAISRDPSLAGRSTTVLHAKSPTWEELDLVVKIGWPSSDRIAETIFLTKAVETAESTAADRWALNHLPRVLFAQDVAFDSNSTHQKVTSLFDKAEFVNGEYKYERRTLRIIIQERLYPLKTLTNVRDIAQVLLDVGCVHRWLCVRAGILHRDLSLSNIMYRIVREKNSAGVVEEKVCGVLTDFDLSSWTEDLEKDDGKTSQRTGTPPFMAYELLEESNALHLYRHDLESLFYIMVILATHYEIRVPTEEEEGGLCMRQGLKELPYQMWFDQPSYETLASLKRAFLSDVEKLNLSPVFEDFRVWLKRLYLSFARGVLARWAHELSIFERRHQGDGSENGDALEFDYEALGGHVDYSALINPVRRLKGKLEGLIIRYDPSLSISTAQTDSSR